MEHSPKFSFRDVLWAPARALQAKQIAFMTLAILTALFVHIVFTYLAYMFQGENLQTIYRAYGFFSFDPGRFDNPLASFSYFVGLAATVWVIMHGFFGVAAINIEAIRGNRFFSLREAIFFTFRRMEQVTLSEVAIILFIAFVVLLFFLLGLITRIPYVGEWVFTIFFVLPNFVVALFTIFIMFVLILSVMLLPTVAAAERQGESFNVILETFSTIIRQPLRWIGYTVYTVVAAKLATFVYAYFCYRAVQFTVWSTSLGAGPKSEVLVKTGLSHLPVHSEFVNQVCSIFPGVKWGFDLPAGLPAYGQPVEYVMAIMLFVIFVSVLGYGMAILAAGQARAYVALRYLKDGYKISDEKSLFLEADK